MIVCASPKSQYLSHKKEIDLAIEKVLTSDKYVLGPEVLSLEEEFADYIGSKYAIGVSNGTDALEIAMLSLGIGKGDEVITVSHTAVATISAIENTGAEAVLVDIEEHHFTLDTGFLSQAISKKTKAIVLVHLYGQSGNVEEVQSFCKKNNLLLIEDVAQAHGASYKEKKLGSFGQIGCFSCYPTKNLGAIGDGGLIVTNDESLYKSMRRIREYGWEDRRSIVKGRNSRLDEIQAAILRVKLKYLDSDNRSRQKIANIYYEINCNELILPPTRKFCDHVFHLFVCKTKRRDELMKYLYLNKVITGIHYPEPVHLQPTYKKKIKTIGSLKITEGISKTIISLPMYPELPSSDVYMIKDLIEEFFC